MSQLGNYLGTYRLLNMVGNGRACQVWEAINDVRGERYALKVVLPSQARDAELLGLMRHEFQVGKPLVHPRVIRTLEFDTSRQAPFVAMEFFGPTNLKQFILQGVDQMAYLVPKIAEQAADALLYFHQQGWIHRDIKPNNFLISAQGDVKLIDFALAERPKGFLGRLFGGRGKIQGTRSYISPEQIRRQALDQRSDIYSFACTLQELIAGKPPFTGSTDTELLNKHLKSGPPPLDGYGRGVKPEFSQLMRRMLAKNPSERPDSMEEVVDVIRTSKIFRTVPPPPKATAPAKEKSNEKKS